MFRSMVFDKVSQLLGLCEIHIVSMNLYNIDRNFLSCDGLKMSVFELMHSILTSQRTADLCPFTPSTFIDLEPVQLGLRMGVV